MPPPALYPPIQNPDGSWGLDPRERNTGFNHAFREHRNTIGLHTLTNENLNIRASANVREITDLFDRFVRPTTPFGQERESWTVPEMRKNIAEFYRLLAKMYKDSPTLQKDRAFGDAYADIQRAGAGKISGLHVAYLYKQIGEFIRANNAVLYQAKGEMARLNHIRGGKRTRRIRRRCQRHTRRRCKLRSKPLIG